MPILLPLLTSFLLVGDSDEALIGSSGEPVVEPSRDTSVAFKAASIACKSCVLGSSLSLKNPASSSVVALELSWLESVLTVPDSSPGVLDLACLFSVELLSRAAVPVLLSADAVVLELLLLELMSSLVFSVLPDPFKSSLSAALPLFE